MTDSRSNKIGVYVHVPFCKSKCNYCSFVSGDYPERVMVRYFELLPKEFQSFFNCANGKYEIETLYIGGGTPSIVLGNILSKAIKALLTLTNKKPIEITIEANPGDITDDFINTCRTIETTRISIGAQSFNPDVLKFLGRRHTAADIIDSYTKLRKNGIDNINIDLILGIPSFGLERWNDDLKKIIELSPEHVSLYALSVEEKTPFFEMGIGEQIDPDSAAEEYHAAVEFLRSTGYKRYEISNFAKSGMECVHNLNYWHLGNYVGFGTAASSYIDGVSSERYSDLNVYLNRLENNQSTIENSVEFHGRDKWLNAVIMGMRLEDGILIEGFKDRFGIHLPVEVKEPWREFINDGHVIIDDERIRFGDDGMYVSNSLLSMLM